MSGGGYFEELLEHVDPAFERVARERRRRANLLRLAAVTAIALLVAGGLVIIGGSKPAAAGVRVTREDGAIVVRLVDVEYRPDVIEKAAKEAGIDLDVAAVPTGPSLVGRFVRANASQDVDVVHLLGRSGDSFSGFRVPVGWDGHLDLKVGRPARGAPYDVFTNAVSEGEPLACTAIVGARAADASRLVRDAGVTASWHLDGPRGASDISAADATGRWRRATVAYVVATSASSVRVFLVAGGADLTPPALTSPATC